MELLIHNYLKNEEKYYLSLYNLKNKANEIINQIFQKFDFETNNLIFLKEYSLYVNFIDDTYNNYTFIFREKIKYDKKNLILHEYLKINFTNMFTKSDEYIIYNKYTNERKQIINSIKFLTLSRNEKYTEMFRYYFKFIYIPKIELYSCYVLNKFGKGAKTEELIQIQKEFELTQQHIYLDYQIDVENENYIMIMKNEEHSIKLYKDNRIFDSYNPPFNIILDEIPKYKEDQYYDNFLNNLYKFIKKIDFI